MVKRKRNLDRSSLQSKRKARSSRKKIEESSLNEICDYDMSPPSNVISPQSDVIPVSRKHMFVYDVSFNYELNASIGGLDYTCPYCCAKLFVEESKGMCCCRGNVKIDLPDPPELIFSLLDGSHEKSSAFLKYIRKYNNALSMTSFGCEEEWDCMTFRISGKVYHKIGSLLPPPDSSPQYLQLYFIGNEEEEARGRANNTDPRTMDEGLILELQRMLHETNHYVRLFKSTFEKICEMDIQDVRVALRSEKITGVHSGRTNLPLIDDDVAIILPGNIVNKRDIIIECKFAKGEREDREFVQKSSLTCVIIYRS